MHVPLDQDGRDRFVAVTWRASERVRSEQRCSGVSQSTSQAANDRETFSSSRTSRVAASMSGCLRRDVALRHDEH